MADGLAQEAAGDREPDPQGVGGGDLFGAVRDRVGRAGGLGREQHPGVGVARIGEDVGGLAGLDDFAVLHHADPVGEFAHDGEVVGDEQERHAEIAFELGEQVEDLGLDGDVERGGGLVGDQQVGGVGEGHGDHHPLALAAGELVRVAGEPCLGGGDADAGEQLEDPLAHRLAADALVQFDRLAELLFQRVQRVERGHRLLEDEADVIAAGGAEFGRAGADHFAALVADRPADPGAVGQQRDGGERGDGFAGAGFAHQRDGLALVDVEAHALDGHVLGAVLAEAYGEVLDVEHLHSKVFRGSKASRTPSKMKTRSESSTVKVMKAVKASQGAWRFCFAWRVSSPSDGAEEGRP